MTEEDFLAAVGDVLDDRPEFDELGQVPWSDRKSERPGGLWRLAEITMVGGHRFVTRVPDELTLDRLPQLPPPGTLAPQVILDPDMPESLKKAIRSMAEQAETVARDEAAETLISSTRADSLQRTAAAITAEASQTKGWFTCFGLDGSQYTLNEHNISHFRILSDAEASAYPIAQGATN